MATRVQVDRSTLRQAIQTEYGNVAVDPNRGYHFHTGKTLASRLDYPAEQVDDLPPATVESFAGVGNPFWFGNLKPGEHVLDLGSGAGFDAIVAARQVGSNGHVIGVDMTPAMIDKARANAVALGLDNLEFREGYLEEIPVESNSIDVVISNGVLNLCPDKEAVMAEIHRVLKPGGRIQISDIIVRREVPDEARLDIDLWTG